MKKIHRFLLPAAPTEQMFSISDPDTVHLMKNVLKLAPGESCIVFSDGSDDYLCSITSIEKQSIALSVQSTIPKKVRSKTVTACVSITKRDSFELIVQKLTELGIAAIIPIISDRTIKQSLRIDRLQKISDEAIEQSGQSSRVHISEPVSLADALLRQGESPQYYFDMDGEASIPGDALALTYYIGPEGGWSDSDLDLFAKQGLKKYSLGNTILRAETAAIAAAHTFLWR